MRRTSAALVALALAALATAPPALARDDSITSFDGTSIVLHFFPAADLRPGQKAPTVLFGPGWSSPGETDADSASDPSVGSVGVGPLRKAGYNVVTWDPRGFGRSGGTVQVDSAEAEGRDVQALLDYIARQPEALLDGANDPRAGMTGVSYGGGIQLVTAAIDRRVDVIAPSIAWNSLKTSLYKDETMKSGWSAFLFATGSTAGRLDPHIQSAFTSGATTGKLSAEDEAWFISRGPGELVERIRIPTFLIQGTVDTLFTPDEAVANHAMLRRAGVPLKMLWFCGGHGACLTDNGDEAKVERLTLAWLARHLKRDRSVQTGPAFEWLDQDGLQFAADRFPVRAAVPLTASGSGTLALVNGGGSGPAVPGPDSGPIGGLAAPITAARATNAVNVTIPAPAAARAVVGAPRVTLTYSGLAPSPNTRVFGQIVDDATGKVLGNQITPIPVVLDGTSRQVTRPLETVAATAAPGRTFTLQLVASSTGYDIQRTGGTVTFSDIRVELPTVDPSAVLQMSGAGTAAAARRCSTRRRVTVHIKRRLRARVRSARVVYRGRTVGRMRGRKGVRVRLRGGTGDRVRVRIVMRMRSGRSQSDIRRYRLCVPRKR